MSSSKPYLREYWTPKFGQLLFWAYAVIAGIGAGLFFAAQQWLLGIFCIAAIFSVRILIETAVVLVEIRDALVDIRDRPAPVPAMTGFASTRPAPSQLPTNTQKPGEMRLE